MPVQNERRVTVAQLVPEAGSSFVYEYDFGDSWEHEILVEQILEPEEHVHYPLCIGGARACPPEDVGGVPGYAEFLEAIRDPEHEEHDNMLIWAGGDFDPEGFDRNRVNAALRRFR